MMAILNVLSVVTGDQGHPLDTSRGVGQLLQHLGLHTFQATHGRSPEGDKTFNKSINGE